MVRPLESTDPKIFFFVVLRAHETALFCSCILCTCVILRREITVGSPCSQQPQDTFRISWCWRNIWWSIPWIPGRPSSPLVSDLPVVFREGPDGASSYPDTPQALAEWLHPCCAVEFHVFCSFASVCYSVTHSGMLKMLNLFVLMHAVFTWTVTWASELLLIFSFIFFASFSYSQIIFTPLLIPFSFLTLSLWSYVVLWFTSLYLPSLSLEILA